MKKAISVFYVLYLIIGLFLGGCATHIDPDYPEQSGKLFDKTRDDSKLPWARPADWEYDMPLGPRVNY